MRVTIYGCTDWAVGGRLPQMVTIAREAFHDICEQEVLDRVKRYPEVAIAEDKDGVAGFVFISHHDCLQYRILGLRFIAIGTRCRNRKLSTYLSGTVIWRTYVRYLFKRVFSRGARRLFVMARICNPKAFFTLTGGNDGISPDLTSRDPSSSVRKRQGLYRSLAQELGLVQFDITTAIIPGAAEAAGIRPNNTRVDVLDDRRWRDYVSPGSEVLMLMPVDWRFMLNNAKRCLRLIVPASFQRY